MGTKGTNLRNRRKRKRKNEIVPRKMLVSMRVGLYVSHDEGRKSWASDVTMRTKRSHHIPTWMKSAATQSAVGLVRTRRDQNTWGTTTLHIMSVQKSGANG